MSPSRTRTFMVDTPSAKPPHFTASPGPPRASASFPRWDCKSPDGVMVLAPIVWSARPGFSGSTWRIAGRVLVLGLPGEARVGQLLRCVPLEVLQDVITAPVLILDCLERR